MISFLVAAANARRRAAPPPLADRPGIRAPAQPSDS